MSPGDSAARTSSWLPAPAAAAAPPPALANFPAEQGLLGALLTNNRAMERIRDGARALEPEHFADPVNGRIFEAVRKLVDRDQVASPITLKAMFDREGDLADIGGFAYLVRLTQTVEAMTNAEDYAATIRDLATRRAAYAACQETMADLQTIDLDRPADKIVEDAEERLHGATRSSGPRKGELLPVADALRASVEQTEAAVKAGGVSGLSTGLFDLDHYLGGLRPGNVLVVAAATSMGKTDFAVNLATFAAKEGETVAFFSLEMSADELASRILARPTGVAASKQGRGQVSPQELSWLAKLSLELQSIPLFIDDTPAPTVEAIAARARRLRRKHGLGLIVVDYLQLIAPGNNRNRRSGNRTEDVTEISRSLKSLAKELGVPVVALAQLSRQLETRENKRPILSDLRESGAIEQDADKVVFLFREEYYLDRDEPRQRPGEKFDAFSERQADHEAHKRAVAGIAEAIVAKNRGGPKGTAKLHYDPARSLFEDIRNRPAAPSQESMFS